VTVDGEKRTVALKKLLWIGRSPITIPFDAVGSFGLEERIRQGSKAVEYLPDLRLRNGRSIKMARIPGSYLQYTRHSKLWRK
jgi:hypothetical protein